MPAWFTRPLTLGDEGDDVQIVQRKVSAPMTKKYDEPTAARVRGLQKKAGLPQSGEVDEKTAELLGEKATAGQVPDWFGADDQDDQVRSILRLSEMESLEDGVRRFRSARGLPLSGGVDEDLSIILASTTY